MEEKSVKHAPKHKKQLYFSKCTDCEARVTVSSPGKQTRCWRCRGWESKNQVSKILKDKRRLERAQAKPKNVNVLERMLHALRNPGTVS